jgi:hypothetical protein
MLKNRKIIYRRKTLKIFFATVVMIGILFMMFLFSCNGQEKSKSIDFETVSKDFYSLQVEKENYVAKDEESLNQILDLIEIQDSINYDIDFSEETVVAVFMGEKSSGGYSIEIVEVVKKEDHLEFVVEVKEPGPDDMTIQAITSPYHIIRLKRFDTEYVFSF